MSAGWHGMGHRILITGSEGFIGSHVCHLLTAHNGAADVLGLDLRSTPAPRSFRADVRCLEQLRQIARHVHPDTVIHMAARADVVVPMAQLGDLFSTNVNGTINVLESMRPNRFVFASSSAVYGNAMGHAVRPRWGRIRPLGAYGMTKAAAEMVCAEWVSRTEGTVVCLRFGNVIGTGCRGLIEYLVGHARRYPDGRPAAQLRGNGTLVRDYVPVSHAAEVLERAAEVPSGRESSVVLNVGSGRAMTNGAVATVVQRVLLDKGLKLTLDVSRPVEPGEASRIVLDPSATTQVLGVRPPTEDDIVQAIEQAALSHLSDVN